MLQYNTIHVYPDILYIFRLSADKGARSFDADLAFGSFQVDSLSKWIFNIILVQSQN